MIFSATETTRLKIESTGGGFNNNSNLVPVQPAMAQPPVIHTGAHGDIQNEFKMLHNKLDKHNEEIMSSQCDIMKVVTQSGAVQASNSHATRKTFEAIGEIQNNLTLIKGKLIYFS